MNTCDICGNEITGGPATCPYCEAPLAAPSTPRTGTGVKTVHIKDGLPTVDEALSRLDVALQQAYWTGTGILRVVHGWGSGGRGGALRDACRVRLQREERQGRIQRWIAGEDYDLQHPFTRQWLKRYPQLQRDIRTDQRNPGISIVEV